MAQVDPAVFYWLNEQSQVTGGLACHVDDFLWAGSKHFVTHDVPVLKSAFHVACEEH